MDGRSEEDRDRPTERASNRVKHGASKRRSTGGSKPGQGTKKRKAKAGAGKRGPKKTAKKGNAKQSDSTKRSRPTIDTFQQDPLFPRIERAAKVLLSRGKVVTPIDVLIEMQLLTPKHVEEWRKGQVPYLEKVIQGNLTRLSRLLRILRFHAHDLKLVPTVRPYTRKGKSRRVPLRFSKTGDRKLEEAYSRHFVWPGKKPFHPPRPKAGE